MASLVILPDVEAFSPKVSQCCPFYSGFRHSPVRRRNQFPCRSWSPAANRLSRLLDQVEREREFENLWAPALLLHLKERRSGDKQSKSATADTDKQSSDKTEEKESHTEEKTSDRKFSVSLELGDAFEPSEISVKLVENCLNIEGKHEEIGDDGHFSSRRFTRSYYLPDDVDIENLTSALSKEGVLTVEAPRLQLKEKESVERNIPIQQATSPEAVEEKKSEVAEKKVDQEDNENSKAVKLEVDEGQRDTSNQSQAAEPTREDSE